MSMRSSSRALTSPSAPIPINLHDVGGGRRGGGAQLVELAAVLDTSGSVPPPFHYPRFRGVGGGVCVVLVDPAHAPFLQS